MPGPAETAPRRIPRRSAGLAVVLGWMVPGLAQVYVNRPLKGLWFLFLVGGTYALGLWLAGFRCVSPERDPVWFVAQALAGGPTAAAWWTTRDLAITTRIPTFDVGLLYVTVAALMNAIAVADALGTVDEFAQARAAAEAEAARARREEEARREAEARAAAEAAALVLPPERPAAPPEAAPAAAADDGSPSAWASALPTIAWPPEDPRPDDPPPVPEAPPPPAGAAGDPT